MSDKENKKVILYSIVLGIFSMAIMLYYGMNKELINNEEIQEKNVQTEEFFAIDGVYDDIHDGKNSKQLLTITLPATSDVETMVVSEEYVNHCIKIQFDNLQQNYFTEHQLTGSKEHIKDIICRYEDGKTSLLIYLTELLTSQQKIEGNMVKVSFVPIQDVYDKIIVVDAGHGGEESGLVYGGVKESDITLKVVLKLKALLEQTDIKVLYTRTEDKGVGNPTRINLANDVNADLFLSVHCAANESDKEIFGVTTYYNEKFFIPDFCNADFAYEVEDKTVRAISGRALGIIPGEEERDLLKNSMVPTAYVEVGFLTNDKELQLLQQDAYIENMAKGLYEAIISSYEKMKE